MHAKQRRMLLSIYFVYFFVVEFGRVRVCDTQLLNENRNCSCRYNFDFTLLIQRLSSMSMPSKHTAQYVICTEAKLNVNFRFSISCRKLQLSEPNYIMKKKRKKLWRIPIMFQTINKILNNGEFHFREH